jgi:hypothetical protein
MENSWQLNLTPKFSQQLKDDSFEYVGYYQIQDDKICEIYVEKEAGC